ncbi:MAG: DUF5665 domain-containing protein [Bacillota bacterium]
MSKKDHEDEILKKENKILKKLDELGERIQGMTIAEYIEMIRSPKRMMFVNFLAGMARGLGFVIGATLLGSIFLFLLYQLANLNLPVIGEFVARIVTIVQEQL